MGNAQHLSLQMPKLTSRHRGNEAEHKCTHTHTHTHTHTDTFDDTLVCLHIHSCTQTGWRINSQAEKEGEHICSKQTHSHMPSFEYRRKQTAENESDSDAHGGIPAFTHLHPHTTAMAACHAGSCLICVC